MNTEEDEWDIESRNYDWSDNWVLAVAGARKRDIDNAHRENERLGWQKYRVVGETFVTVHVDVPEYPTDYRKAQHVNTEAREELIEAARVAFNRAWKETNDKTPSHRRVPGDRSRAGIRAAFAVLENAATSRHEYGVTTIGGIHEFATIDGARQYAKELRAGIMLGSQAGDLRFHGLLFVRTRTEESGPWSPVDGGADVAAS